MFTDSTIDWPFLYDFIYFYCCHGEIPPYRFLNKMESMCKNNFVVFQSYAILCLAGPINNLQLHQNLTLLH